ncbi:MAG: hypothetical protein JSS75_04180 [Bacteroidetes bacterium]|nr:hypothetical protein [Bacteroidota bacterium]
MANWNDWQDFAPVDPVDILANCQMIAGTNPIETGSRVNSTTFRTPTSRVLPIGQVTGVSISSLGPIQTLANMPTDIVTLETALAGNPQVIDITFSSAVDAASVTTASFTVTTGGAGVAGTVSVPSANVARFTAFVPFGVGTYSVTLIGAAGPPHVTFAGGTRILDGDPLQLPSGNGTSGGTFTFTFKVSVSPSNPILYPGANIGGWNGTQFALNSDPLCTALRLDDQLAVANAQQWTFSHDTANLQSSNPLPLENTIFLRAGVRWQMAIDLNLGTLTYSNLQLGFQFDAGTRGDCQGTIPVIEFATGGYTGPATMFLTLKRQGRYRMGLRAIDVRGNYYMYETVWNIVP